MNDAEREAHKIVEEWKKEWSANPLEADFNEYRNSVFIIDEWFEGYYPDITPKIKEALESAEKRTAERCAKIAKECATGEDDCHDESCRQVAEAIRKEYGGE